MEIPGCEDAPVIGVARGVVPKALTLITAYYENPVTLGWQVAGWSRYPAHLRELLTVIVVDDGSPDHPAAEVLRPPPPGLRLRLFRIDVDVRWNQDAARNIAVHHATDDWILLIDIDHVVTPELLDAVIHGMHDPGVIHRFNRRKYDRKGRTKHLHPHPNSWLMTREMYWRVGGYDEALAGYYGTDEDYRRRCVATAPILLPAST
jgi:glycosyltransferase involved in cell wall biosynthesis